MMDCVRTDVHVQLSEGHRAVVILYDEESSEMGKYPGRTEFQQQPLRLNFPHMMSIFPPIEFCTPI